MSRIFLTLPDHKSAVETIEELKQLGLDDEHIHVIPGDATITKETHTHKATEFHTTDAWHMGIQGMIIGSFFAASIFVFNGLEFEPLLFIRTVLLGSAVGSIACMVIGASRDEPHIEAHAKDVENGGSVVIADMYRGQELRTLRAITSHHPEATIEKAGVF